MRKVSEVSEDSILASQLHYRRYDQAAKRHETGSTLAVQTSSTLVSVHSSNYPSNQVQNTYTITCNYRAYY